MGTIKHHAIIVTSHNREKLEQVRDKAIEIFGNQVTGICRAAVNLHDSFLIGPDGSSENWSESETGDMQRFEFKTYLENLCYEDGSSPISWVEVFYDDEKSHKAGVIDHCHNKKFGE